MGTPESSNPTAPCPACCRQVAPCFEHYRAGLLPSTGLQKIEEFLMWTGGICLSPPRHCLFVAGPKKLFSTVTDGSMLLAGCAKGTQALLLGRVVAFRGRKPHTSLKLDPAVSHVAASSALRMAAHAAHEVTLRIGHSKPMAVSSPLPPHATGSEDYAWLQAMLQPWLTAATGPAPSLQQPPALDQITVLVLTSMKLDHPFPACISEACPHLQGYTLQQVRWPASILMDGVVWPSLKELALYCDMLQLPGLLSPTNFPSLAELQLGSAADYLVKGRPAVVPRDPCPSPTEKEGLLACCANFGKQLTCLCVLSVWKIWHGEGCSIRQLFLNTQFPQLKTAHFAWRVQDEEFHALLAGSPHLTDLKVRQLVLKEQHTWRQHNGLRRLGITVWDNDFIGTLHKLPIMPLLETLAHPCHLDISWPVDQHMLAAVMASLPLHQFSLLDKRLVFVLTCKDASVGTLGIASRLHVLRPLLEKLHSPDVRMFDFHVSKTLLTALAPLMWARMCFASCTWETGQFEMVEEGSVSGPRPLPLGAARRHFMVRMVDAVGPMQERIMHAFQSEQHEQLHMQQLEH